MLKYFFFFFLFTTWTRAIFSADGSLTITIPAASSSTELVISAPMLTITPVINSGLYNGSETNTFTVIGSGGGTLTINAVASNVVGNEDNDLVDVYVTDAAGGESPVNATLIVGTSVTAGGPILFGVSADGYAKERTFSITYQGVTSRSPTNLTFTITLTAQAG